MKTLSQVVGKSSVEVCAENTATAVHSGTLPVFGTPYMIALMEQATCNAIAPFLEENETTVGTKINVAHIKATGIGRRVEAEATLKNADGRCLLFDVIAREEGGQIIGQGSIERFVVNIDRFMQKVQQK